MRSAGVLALTMFLGCGDDVPSRPDAAPTPACDWTPPDDEDRFVEPADFPRDGCEPGALAGADLEGVWRVEVDARVTFDILSLAIEPSTEGWRARLAGGETVDVASTSDDVVIRRALTAGLYALDLCAEEDGALLGSMAYCNSEGECVTGPASARRFEPLDEPRSTAMRLLGEYGPWPVNHCGTGQAVSVRVQDDIAYLARYGDGLRILDVSDPEAIVELGHVPTTWTEDYEIWNDVKIADGPTGRRHALMASSTRGVVVVDVSDPADPRVTATMTPPQPSESLYYPGVHTLFVEEGRAYLTFGNYGIDIWDVQNPATPRRLSGAPTLRPSRLHDLFVRGDRAYLANIWNSLEIVDVSDPSALVTLGELATLQSHAVWLLDVEGRTVAAIGGEGLDSKLQVVDVTEGTAAFATVLGEWQTRPETSIHNVMAAGRYVFVAYYQDGIRVLDLADPENPVEVAHYQTWTGLDHGYGFQPLYEGAFGIDVHADERRVYVADSHRGVMILEYDLP